MGEIKRIFNLSKGLLLKLRATIKSSDLISYDQATLNNIFIDIAILIGIIGGLCVSWEFLLAIFLFMVVLIPIIIILQIRIFEFLFYIYIKLFGREIVINYEIIKIMLNPILLTELILTLFAALVTHFVGNALLSLIFSLSLFFWFLYVLFLLLRFRLKQRFTRSLLLIYWPIFLTIIFAIKDLIF